MAKTTKPRKPVRVSRGKSGEAVRSESLAKPASTAEVDGWEIELSCPKEQPTNEELAKQWRDAVVPEVIAKPEAIESAAKTLAELETQLADATAQLADATAQAAQKPRRQDHTFGIGEYYDPKHRSFLMGVAFFFDAVRRLVPDVFTELEALMGDELDERVRVPVGPEVIAKPGAFTKLEKLYEDPSSRLDLPSWLPNRWADDPRVIKWATRRGMADAHILLTVTTSMDAWARNPERRRSWVIAEPPPPDLTIQVLPWNPSCELEREFDARVNAYKKVVMNAADARGWKPTRDAMPTRGKRTQPGESIERHFEWLALRVVGRLHLDEILDRYSVDADASLSLSAIHQGIQAAAALAGVTVPGRRV